MTNTALLITHAVIYELFAILLFFFPELMWPFYGVDINDEYARFLSQHNSIFLGGLAVLCWLFRNVQVNTETARKLFLGLVWTNGLGAAITIYACLKGVFVGFGRSDPAFFALLTLLCFVQMKKNQAQTI